MENLSAVLDFADDSTMKLCLGNFFPLQIDALRDGYLAKIAGKMDFTAFLPGEQDLAHYGTLTNSNLPLICANLILNDVPVFSPSLVKVCAGIKVFIIGLWSSDTFYLLPDSLQAIWRLRNWEEAFSLDLLGKIRSEDVFIVLLRGSEDLARAILDRFPQVDLVLNGEGTGDNLKPYGKGDIVNIGKRHASVGLLKFTPLNYAWGDQPLIKIEDYSFIALKQNEPPPPPEVKAWVDEYYRIWYENLEKQRRQYKGTDKVFLGSQYCGKCHAEEYESWRSSPHGRAFERLGHYENRCLPCHTTGFGYPTGFLNPEFTPKMVSVGC